MATITSKYQVTIPKKIADKYNLKPGDIIDWQEAGEAIRVVPAPKPMAAGDREERLRLFDQATERIRKRWAGRKFKEPRDRGWKREDLYLRGRSH
jgi:AbrB family looped-hinge helix DNA binding protein